jgi:1-acyl-sn-glycerol-3-phosphate acyltransferase
VTLFRPTSPCGDSCLAGTGATAPRPVRVARTVAAVTVVAAAAGAGYVVGVLPGRLAARFAPLLLRTVARTLLRVLGVRISRTGGAMPASAALVVANHVSWLDIVAMVALGDVRLLAKSDVEAWPIIGRLARLSGAIFIDRARPSRLPVTVAEIRDALAGGGVVAAFPEGTTTCGRHAVGYRPAVFQAAIDAGVPVVPVTFHYRTSAGDPTAEAAFIGEETLLTSLRRVIAMPGVDLGVRVSAPVRALPPGVRRPVGPGALRAALAIAATPGRRARYAIAAGPSGPH